MLGWQPNAVGDLTIPEIAWWHGRAVDHQKKSQR
ncbi:hypothetical protein [Methylorubrum rhodinum]